MITHILQKRDQQGFIMTITKSPDGFDQNDVLKKYGPGYYCDKKTSPRFHTIWKGWLGESSDRNNLVNKLSEEVDDLRKKSTYLAVGEGLLAVGEAVGFGVTGIKLIEYGQRLNRLESIVGAVNARNPLGFVCPVCLQVLADLFKPLCTNCGEKLDWTHAREPDTTRTQKLEPGKLRFRPVRKWSLP